MDIEHLKECLNMHVLNALKIGIQGMTNSDKAFDDCIIKVVYPGVYLRTLVYSKSASEQQMGHGGNMPSRKDTVLIGCPEKDRYGHWWVLESDIAAVHEQSDPKYAIAFIDGCISSEELKMADIQSKINDLLKKRRELAPEVIQPAVRHLDLDD